MTYFDNIQVAFSRLLNAIIHGDCGQMLSSRAYEHREAKPYMYRFLNAIFWWQVDHCKQSYEWEQTLK